MPIRGTPTGTIQILLNHVIKVIKSPESQQNSNQADNDLLNSFKDIQKVLEDMTQHFFPQFNLLDEDLMKILSALEECIDDVDKIPHQQQQQQQEDQDDKIKKKIKSIEQHLQQLQDIRKLISQIQLPKLEKTSTLPGQQALSEAQARKVSEDWLRFRVEDNILASPAMANLQLSYDILDIQLKLCLLCLAIFPEKALVKKKPLIYWWIGEGLISKSRDKSAEEVGEGIFVKLIEKGLIEPFHKGNDKKNPIMDGCTMHPWIRRMLIGVAKRAEFFDLNDSGKIDNENNKSKRVCLALGNQGFSGTLREDELFTIFNVNEQYLSFKPELFLKLKKVMILQLGRWQDSDEHHIEVENDEFLNELRAQKHLRYLSLHGISRITVLPSSINECINLEILDLRACHNLERLPSNIGSLRKLTHLDVSQCYLLESMPKGIEKLYSLQVLKGFVIGHSRKNPCKLGDLAQLKKLRKLSIYIGSEAVAGEEELNKLKEIGTLRVLTISWGGVALVSKNGEPVDNKTSSDVGGGAPPIQKKEGTELTRTATLTMKSFSFPPKLEKLDLRCFPRRQSPDWLTARNMEELKRLYIRGGELDKFVSVENKKWKVKNLRLKYLKNLKVEHSVLKEDFPDLVYFEKVKCHQIVANKYDQDVEWKNGEGWEALRSKLESTEKQDAQDVPTPPVESKIHEVPPGISGVD